MILEKITIEGYGPFHQCDIRLLPEEKEGIKSVIIIGENGAGKSIFLNACAVLLSQFVYKITENKENRVYINKNYYNNDKYTNLSCNVNHNGCIYNWNILRRTQTKSDINGLKNLCDCFTDFENNNTSFPILVYYSSDRVSPIIMKSMFDYELEEKLDGYKDSFNTKNDFSLLIKWMKWKEDIINEYKVVFEDIAPYIYREKFAKSNERIDNIYDMNKYLDLDYLKNNNPYLFKKITSSKKIIEKTHFYRVSDAISRFMEGYTKPRLERYPEIRLLIDKDGKPIDFKQLSHGEKNLFTLIGDIAIRLSLLNPGLEDPFQGEGIVLIDEIDLHLHPKWQRMIMGSLQTLFPNIQFIVTTHSPLIINDTQNANVLFIDNGVVTPLSKTFGMNIDEIYLRLMDTPIQNEELQAEFDSLLDAIQKGDRKKIKSIREELLKKLPSNHIELMRAEILERRLEAIRAKNSQRQNAE